jgi:apolipoprotein N-acyltransferase
MPMNPVSEDRDETLVALRLGQRRPSSRMRPVEITDRADTTQISQPIAFLSSALGGLILAIAWLVPQTAMSASLGWIATGFIAFTVRAQRPYMPLYVCGLVGHAVGFSWVFNTVTVFGGFGLLPSVAIFAAFVTSGALQFFLFAYVFRQLGGFLDTFALRTPTAWVLAELVTIRLFRWHLGHTQVAFTPFVQVAGLGGAMLVSFLMVWLADAGIRLVVFRERRWRLVLPPVFTALLALGYGIGVIRTFEPYRSSGDQDVTVVQGNAAFAEKHDLESADRYVNQLYDLTLEAARPGRLIVWPEGAIPAFLPAGLRSVRDKGLLPWLDNGSALLVGTYAVDEQQRRYNAAFAVSPDGSVPPPYFKQILIPFGESIPFASSVPWLAKLNARAGIFTAGSGPRVFAIAMRGPDGTARTLRVAPLICYEDTIPDLARDATRAGAELLVNLTSDSWFGRSVALRQHHLIASFRAIENRRYLVRATTTGLSAVVDPLGRTIASIPPAAEGTVTTRVKLLSCQSAYASFVGERPWWTLLALSVAFMMRQRICAAAVSTGRWFRSVRNVDAGHREPSGLQAAPNTNGKQCRAD